MPIPSPGTYDQASQATLLTVKAKTDIIGASVALEAAGNLAAVKAKTDIIGASVALEAAGNLAAVKAKTDVAFNGYVYMQLLPRRGNAVQGTWSWSLDAGCTEWLTDRKLDAAGQWYNGASLAINDEYAYPVFLPAGAYSVEIYYVKTSNAGILSLRLGADVLGTVDMYAAAQAHNSVTVVDFVVAADTVANLRFLIATKNEASSGYAAMFQRITLWRRT